MTRAWLRLSRARWVRKLKYRTAKLAEARKDGHAGTGIVTDSEAERIHKWERHVQKAKAMIARRDAQLNPPAVDGQKALAFLRRYIGKTEQPPGSNRAPWGLTDWQTALGSWLVGQPWCGTACGTALKHAGVKGITSRVAGVVLILDDAMNSRNGFRHVVYRRSTGQGAISSAQPGDLVGLFGESTHVGMFEKRVPGGIVCLEGNTSAGNSGSQSNGGGCFRRTRPSSAVAYVVRPDWS